MKKMTNNKMDNYNLIDLKIVSGNLLALYTLIKKHNDYRGIVEDDGTYSVAMYLHTYRMDSPYITDFTKLSNKDYMGYAIATIAVLPHITPAQIQSAIDNGDDNLRGLIEVIEDFNN
jgi:hypothetical protein